MQEKRRLIQWIQRHRQQLIAAGICIATLVAIILGIRKRDVLKTKWEQLQALIKSPFPNNEKEPIENKEEDSPISTIEIDSEEFEETLEASDSEEIEPQILIDPNSIQILVEKHLRNLHQGQNASKEKKESAKEAGFELQDNQTWVKDYSYYK